MWAGCVDKTLGSSTFRTYEKCSPIVGAGGVALDGDHGDRIRGEGMLRLAAGERRRRLAELVGTEWRPRSSGM